MTMTVGQQKRVERKLIGTLAGTLFKHWGDALRFCRQARRLKTRQVADFVGVGEHVIQLWELGDSVPPSNKLCRLHAMIWELKHHRHLLLDGAIKKADTQQKVEAEALKNPRPLAPKAPPPELPPVKRSLSDAVRILRRSKGMSAREMSQATGISVGAVLLIEKGVDGIEPKTYKRLIEAYPELKTATPPPIRIGKGQPIPPEDVLNPPPPVPVAPPPPPEAESAVVATAEPGVATFSTALRVARAKRGLNIGEMAKLCGLSGSCISKIEQGTDKVAPTTFRALLAAFPELIDAPLPSVMGGHGKKYDATLFLPRPQTPPATPPPPAPPSPAPAPALTGAGAIAQELAMALGRLAEAKKRADETMEIAMKADAEYKAAQATVDQTNKALRESMGLTE